MGAHMCNASSPIDQADIEQIEQLVNDSFQEIIENYQEEKKSIVEQMRRAAPAPYENLRLSDYPKKNETQVNKLAFQRVVTVEAKKRIVNKVIQQIQPRIDSKVPNATSLERSLIEKALRKAVEQAVDKAIDKLVEKINKINN